MKSMAGVTVLLPHDSLNNHPDGLFSTSTKPRRTVNYAVSDGRRRTPTKGMLKKHDTKTVTEPSASKSLVTGRVKLLKHGESMVPKQIHNSNISEFFAGSAFVDSPPPSSVPLPGFFTKKIVAAVTNDPTSDLRRILGLSL